MMLCHIDRCQLSGRPNLHQNDNINANTSQINSAVFPFHKPTQNNTLILTTQSENLPKLTAGYVENLRDKKNYISNLFTNLQLEF
jgi:hypothetical protein